MAKAKEDNREIVTLEYRQHVLTRSGMYIGSTKPADVDTWILNDEDKLEYKTVKVVEGLKKIISEILDNSIDEGLKTDWNYSTKISINIDKTTCTIEDNGRGFPVKKTADGEWMPVIALCKGMSGSNFNDDNNRKSIGQNGTGSKCTVIFSKKFECVTCDGHGKLKIVCEDNLSKEKHTVLTPTAKTGTKITFTPDFERFGVKEFDDTLISLIRTRLKFLAWFFPKCTFTLNGEKIAIKVKELSSMFPQPVSAISNDKAYIAVYPSDEPFILTYLDGLALKGGSHVDYISNKIISDIRDKVTKKYKNIKPSDIRNRISFVIFLKDLPNSSFTSQTKEILANAPSEIGDYLRSIDIDLESLSNKVLKEKEIIENITDIFQAKEELAEKKAVNKLAKKERNFDSDKYFPPVGKSKKKYLMVTEGASAFAGISPILGRQDIGYYMLKGKPLNVLDEKPSKYMANREIKELVQILGIDIDDPNTDMEYEKVVILSDADSDGVAIGGLIISLFSVIAPAMLKAGRVCRMETPLLIGLKGDKVEEYYFSFPEKSKMNKKLDYHYMKGLGSWTKARLNQVIDKEGGMDKLLISYEFDKKAKDSISNWFSAAKSDERKKALRGREFHIDNV